MIKYVSILNQPKFFPIEDATDDYVATEKIDGMNFQIGFYQNGDVKYFSRSQEIPKDSKDVKGYLEVLERPDFVKLFKEVKSCLRKRTELASISLFGEFYGKGIQNRIPYRENDKDIIFFDVVLVYPLKAEQAEEDLKVEWLTRKALENLFKKFELLNLLTPVAIRGTWKDIAEFDVEKFSSLLTYVPAIAEGIVVRHYSVNKLSYNRPEFLKLKTIEFKERKTKQPKLIVEPTEAELLFGEYINSNRMLSFFSKEGNFNDIRRMAFYIKGIVDDAWLDFVIDYPEFIDEKKAIVSKQGAVVSKMLQIYLKDNLG